MKNSYINFKYKFNIFIIYFKIELLNNFKFNFIILNIML